MDKVLEERTEPTERATLTVYEAAKLLGVGRNQTYQAIREGKIPHLRIGSRIVIPRAALSKLLNGAG
jgi:excisionase family DNA binding protein